MEIKQMKTKCTYLFNNIEYSIISKNDIDLRIGKKKVDNLVKEKESLINSIEEILLRSDSNRIVYYYKEDKIGLEKPIDFLNEVNSKFNNYTVFINMNICKDNNQYLQLNKNYTEVTDFFDENENINLAINGAFVENKNDEYIDIFVSI